MLDSFIRLLPISFLCGSLLISVDSFAQDKNANRAKAGEAIAKLSKEVDDARLVVSNRWVADWISTVNKFLASIARMLKPSGLFVIYNFCPAKAPQDKPYVPWADGESPFSKEAFENCGFEVLHFDVKDELEARRLAHALKWDVDGGMNLDSDLFAWYTIVRKKSEPVSIKP